MEPNIFKYVWRHSRSEQVAILLIVLASLPFYYLSLNLPKQIVNEGIQGQDFDQPGATQPFFAFDQIGRAHVCTPVTNAHLVCRLLLEKKKTPNYTHRTHPLI